MEKSQPSTYDRLMQEGYDNIVLFAGHSYDDAIIGVTECCRVVYDYEKMIEWLSNDEGWSVEDCIEWIDYNVISSLPYMGEKSPLIMYPIKKMKA